MKKLLSLLLSVLIIMSLIPVAALGFGEPTPPTNNSDTGNSDTSGSSSGGNNPNTDTSGSSSGSNSPNTDTSGGNNTGGSNSGDNSSDSSNSGGNSPNSSSSDSSSSDSSNSDSSNSDGSPQPGGTVVNTYEPGAYATEKNTNQQIIEDAQQQYGGPRLAGLSVGGLSLIPVFSSETFYYTAYVPDGQNSISISATASTDSIVYIDGAATGIRQISVGSEEKTVHIIVVTGSSSTTYSILLLRQQQVQAIPQQQLPADFPVLTHVRLENSEFLYEQDIYTTGGDIYITLPNASKKSFSITLSANINVVTYCNNIRVYNVVYNTQAGAWQWKRQYIEMRIPETRLEIFLANQGKLDVVNTYTLILRQPTEALNIQLQVGNDEALVNDVVHTLDAPPVILGGHTMVPLRFIAEALGAQVSWDSAAKRVELNWQGQKLELFIGRQTDNMPQAPFIENGRTMVPLRYVSENLNCQVEWVAATKEIIITR